MDYEEVVNRFATRQVHRALGGGGAKAHTVQWRIPYIA